MRDLIERIESLGTVKMNAGLLIWHAAWVDEVCTREDNPPPYFARRDKLNSDFLRIISGLGNMAKQGSTMVIHAPIAREMTFTNQVLIGWGLVHPGDIVGITGGICYDPRQPEITMHT